MFGAQEKGGEPSAPVTQSEDTVIGKTIKIEGDLVSQGNIIVEGEVVGSLKTDKLLRVGQGAKVNADVKANNAYIAGELSGNVDVTDKIELTETAQVTGDLKAGVISISAGAQFNGNCSMDSSGVNVVSSDSVSKEDNNEQEKEDEE